MKTIFDIYSKEEIEKKINEINNLINKGFKDDEIAYRLKYELIEELISIARARIKSKKDNDKYIGEVKYFKLSDLRFATPENIAKYRAKRLTCDKIADLCSGIGIQSTAFSKTCREVIAIEIDDRKIKYSKENFKDINNIKFIEGDVLDIDLVKQIKKFGPNIVFCDPERLIQENQRNLNSINPDLKKLVEIYSRITPNICIEMPPQIDLEKIKTLGDFEAEYLSLDNKLNRLNLYFGNMKKSDVSCVDAKTGIRLEKNNKEIEIKKIEKSLKYIYEVSDGVIKAGLVEELANNLNIFILINSEKGKALLTSEKIINGKFLNFLKIYEVIDIADSLDEISKILKKRGFGKVLIKYSIDPKEYWKERNFLEKSLNKINNKEATLFVVFEKNKKKYLLCQKITS